MIQPVVFAAHQPVFCPSAPVEGSVREWQTKMNSRLSSVAGNKNALRLLHQQVLPAVVIRCIEIYKLWWVSLELHCRRDLLIGWTRENWTKTFFGRLKTLNNFFVRYFKTIKIIENCVANRTTVRSKRENTQLAQSKPMHGTIADTSLAEKASEDWSAHLHYMYQQK